tara:strand:+ start:626 stop:856 length:231 start_codon:yes stop_codon:yes gene_type:complete
MVVQTLKVPCRKCDDDVRVEADSIALMQYELRQGLIQELFPNHSADEREAIMGWRNTGDTLCPECWDRLFPEEENE